MVNIFSIVIPVYRNAESIPDLIDALTEISVQIAKKFQYAIEVVFVVDGCPDKSYSLLEKALPSVPFASQLLLHSRNFGSFAAIRSGLQVARGKYFGVIAADLQEPPELLLQFLGKLNSNECDVVVGCRENREDPLMSRLASNIFWKLYKRFVIPEIPEKGVDVFGCNKAFRDHLLQLDEANSSLIGLIFWLGFRRHEVMYKRSLRKYGKSAWTLKKKINYFSDSIFSFTDMPIKLLTMFGFMGLICSLLLGSFVLLIHNFGGIIVPGYTATVLIVMFFGGLNSLGLGIVGNYAWRAFENTKGRPVAVLMSALSFNQNLTIGR